MPLDPKLTKFTTASPVLATFDATDVEEGAGITNYNASSEQETTNVSYFLTRTTNPSDEIYTFLNSGATTPTELFDLDFDITLQAPKDMAKGTAHIILAMGIGSDVTVARAMYAVVTLKKNTTTIGSAVRSRDVGRPNGTAAHTPFSDVVNIPIPIASGVHFGIGDILRVNIVVWGWGVSGTGDYALGHDPADRNDTRAAAAAKKIFEDDKSTKSIFSIPFLIQP